MPDDIRVNTDPLLAIQAHIDASRVRFLEAVATSSATEKRDSQRIIERFLQGFRTPKPGRSTLAPEQAQEAEQLLRQFGGTRASLCSRVLSLNIVMSCTMTDLEIATLAAWMEPGAHRSEIGGEELSPIQSLRRNAAELRSLRHRAAEKHADIIDTAVTIGEHVCKVQNAATLVLETRDATLRTFLQTHLDDSLPELLRRLREALNAGATSEVRDAVFREIAEIVAELLDVAVGDVLHIKKIPRLIQSLRRIVRGKQRDDPINDTDRMQTLLEQLIRENTILEKLNLAYEAALEELDRVRQSSLNQIRAASLSRESD